MLYLDVFGAQLVKYIYRLSDNEGRLIPRAFFARSLGGSMFKKFCPFLKRWAAFLKRAIATEEMRTQLLNAEPDSIDID